MQIWVERELEDRHFLEGCGTCYWWYYFLMCNNSALEQVSNTFLCLWLISNTVNGSFSFLNISY